jgi:hypothetical protein
MLVAMAKLGASEVGHRVNVFLSACRIDVSCFAEDEP